MKKVLHHIRQKPPEFRLVISVVLALLVTGGIAAIWISATFGNSPHAVSDVSQTASVANVPSPIDAIKSAVSGVGATYQAATTGTQANTSDQTDAGNTVQIINAGAPNDESNPASNNPSGNTTTN